MVWTATLSSPSSESPTRIPSFELFSDPTFPFCRITKKVAAGVHQGVTTVELDNLAAETAAYLTTKHPDYAILAARIAISNLHKETKKIFSEVVHDLYKWGECREDVRWKLWGVEILIGCSSFFGVSQPQEWSSGTYDFG